MSVPIYQEGTQCGMLQDTTQGLYTRFSGRLKAQGLCRVYGVYPEGEISLGVPVPEGYWLEPSPGSGIVLHVPTEEVEEVFGQ